MKYLTAYIFRSVLNPKGKTEINLYDNYNEVTIVDIPGAFAPSENIPPVKIHARVINGKEYVYCEPSAPGRYAFGGTMIYSEDERFPAKYPIPLHDRQMDKE